MEINQSTQNNTLSNNTIKICVNIVLEYSTLTQDDVSLLIRNGINYDIIFLDNTLEKVLLFGEALEQALLSLNSHGKYYIVIQVKDIIANMYFKHNSYDIVITAISNTDTIITLSPYVTLALQLTENFALYSLSTQIIT